MENAYDVKVLGERLKALGLPVLEDTAEKVLKELFVWLKESAVLSKTPYDDMISLIYPQIEAFIKSHIDKIDGVQG
jgi:hypothetical protein